MINATRPVSWVSGILAVSLAGFAAFVSFLPFGTVDSLLTLGPQFVICIVFYWVVRAPRLLPPAAVFAVGLAIDLFSAGPLGFWGLVYLSAYAVTLGVRERIERKGITTYWAGFSCIAAASAALAWGLGSIYFAAWLPTWPLVAGAAITIAAFPLLSVVFAPLCGRRRPRTV